jgi:hypothetical protein
MVVPVLGSERFDRSVAVARFAPEQRPGTSKKVLVGLDDPARVIRRLDVG